MSGQESIGYRKIADFYEHLIRTGKLAPGEVLPSEDELAHTHGVTRTTLRRAFAVLVNRGLVVKKQGRGSFVAPADAVASRARRRVTIAVWRAPSTADEFELERSRRRHGHYEFIQGVVDTLAEYGRPFRIQYFDETPRSIEALASVVRQEQDLGILAFDVEYPEPMDGLLAIGLPVIFVDSLTMGKSVDVVQAANREGMKEATLHLLRTTAGPLAFVGSRVSPQEGTPHRERLEGFRDAHRELARELREDYLFFEWVDLLGGGKAGRKILDLDPRPTGVVCSDDDLAHGVLDVLQAAGIEVPAEVSLVGFGNAVHSRGVVPSLTTVAMDIATMGKRAVELLEQRIKQPGTAPVAVAVPTNLILRQSTPLPTTLSHVRLTPASPASRPAGDCSAENRRNP